MIFMDMRLLPETSDIRSRLLIFASAFILVIAVLLTQLYSLQVVNGHKYTELAAANTLRESTTIAPRGRIFDRNGNPLVVNRSTLAVLAPTSIVNDKELVSRLAQALHMSDEQVVEKATTQKEAALDLRVIAIDVPMETVAFIEERSNEFVGIEIQSRAVRDYPNGSLAAHVLGYTGEISDNDLKSPDFKDYSPSDIVGKTGAERSFESVLQGIRGRRILEVDATGKLRQIVEEAPPESGQDISLTLDIEVQKVAEKALVDAINDAKAKGYNADAASAVVMDVTNGEILAMANVPTYNPNDFIGGISTEIWKNFTSKESNYPLQNRAIMSMYPPASTFKPFIGFAALNNGLANAHTSYVCPGLWKGLGEQWSKYCWLHSGHGSRDITTAMRDSCDTYFYEIGLADYRGGKELIQKTSRDFGYGQKIGIDLPGEVAGRVPDAEWKAEWNKNYPEYKRWLPGDTVNLAIGQGDLLATPLQVAASYAGIAAGGVIQTPHVLKSVHDSSGDVIIENEAEEFRRPNVSDESRKIIYDSLRTVITTGTGKSAFRGFGIDISGKTGTAQMSGKDDYAWFVGYGPTSSPKYCVAVVIEQGGSGGGIAGPAGRQIFAQLFGKKVEHIGATDNSR